MGLTWGIVMPVFGLAYLVCRWRKQQSKRQSKQQSKQRSTSTAVDDLTSSVWVEMRQKYGISPKFGFLPERPIEKLTHPTRPACVREYYYSWELLSDSLPSIQNKEDWDRACALVPLLRLDLILTLKKEEKGEALVLDLLRRCNVLLGQAVHVCVHYHRTEIGEGSVVVPQQLGTPFIQVCKLLGLPAILTAAALDLWNWKYTSEPPKGTTNGAIMDFTTCVSTITNTTAEIGFHMIPFAMHHRANRDGLLVRVFHGIPPIVTASAAPPGSRSSSAAELNVVRTILEELTSMFKDFLQIFKEVSVRVDLATFYERYRPFLGSFGPKGVWLETADGEQAVSTALGPSAGQSTMFVLFDILLGLSNGKELSDGTPIGTFQNNMMQYMPTQARHFLVDFQNSMDGKSIKSFLSDAQGEGRRTDLTRHYEECVRSYAALRSYHFHVATSYLKATSTGTGGTTFKTLLHNAIQRTQDASNSFGSNISD